MLYLGRQRGVFLKVVLGFLNFGYDTCAGKYGFLWGFWLFSLPFPNVLWKKIIHYVYCVFWSFGLVDFIILVLLLVLWLNISDAAAAWFAGLLGSAPILFVLNFWAGLPPSLWRLWVDRGVFSKVVLGFWNFRYDLWGFGWDVLRWLCRHVHRKISAHVVGGQAEVQNFNSKHVCPPPQ